MAISPQFKIYNGKEYVAACKYAEDAAALVAVLGEGASIRYGHSLVVWREGQEFESAGESYDGAAETMFARIKAASEENMRKIYSSN